MKNKFDTIIVGNGHSGVEAAFAISKFKQKILILSTNIKKFSVMYCNPSIGGPAKGTIVKEIDALGGIMGKIADLTALQFRMLNSSKGPGARSLRVQSDKIEYSEKIKNLFLKKKNITILKNIVEDIIVKKKKIFGVICKDKKKFFSKTVIIATGTFMNSNIFCSKKNKKLTPDGSKSSNKLSISLKKRGFEILRFKTGTSARIFSNSIDFSKLKKQKIDYCYKKGYLFSRNKKKYNFLNKQLNCYITYTNKTTHNIIKKNIKKSSIFSGLIKGIGARYCPSIEEKIIRFFNKKRHQIFLEPESKFLKTIYLQGLSTSLPEKVQDLLIRSIKGLEKCKIKKYGYAIEYDVINPLYLKKTLESKKIKGLFFSGQINGTSGYEEAAAQGLIAGINAALKNINNKKSFVLKRNESYIGVMIDDIVTKGITDPYRMLTSRSEFRLFLRFDNAYKRLSLYAFNLGLIDKLTYYSIIKEEKKLLNFIKKTKNINLLKNEKIFKFLKKNKFYNKKKKIFTLFDVIKKFNNADLNFFFSLFYPNFLNNKNKFFLDRVIIEIRYKGYIKKTLKEIKKMQLLEKLKIPSNINYNKFKNLSKESIQKLNIVKPTTISQASRISGVLPSDVYILALNIKKNNYF